MNTTDFAADIFALGTALNRAYAAALVPALTAELTAQSHELAADLQATLDRHAPALRAACRPPTLSALLAPDTAPIATVDAAICALADAAGELDAQFCRGCFRDWLDAETPAPTYCDHCADERAADWLADAACEYDH